MVAFRPVDAERRSGAHFGFVVGFSIQQPRHPLECLPLSARRPGGVSASSRFPLALRGPTLFEHLRQPTFDGLATSPDDRRP